ncbi:hypothetical protein [Streptomyces sp. NPDC048155]|uniref:hypothetical protein n=1 Tax=unclassified Streptomyces TaxID=2593676 RepID=UPI0033CA15AC
MTTTDTCGEFLAAVAKLRDDGTVRLTAHTSSVSADAWTAPDPDAQVTPATPTDSAS